MPNLRKNVLRMFLDTSSKLSDLVNFSPKIGAALHDLGIYFHQYHENSLEEICRKKSLNAQRVIQSLEQAIQNNFPPPLDLSEVSLDMVIAYLQQTHAIFIKKKLPYLAYLIDNLPNQNTAAKEVKMIFPLFLEDFIKHIYQEEDIVFGYILQLQKIVRHRRVSFVYKEQIESHAIQVIQAEHQHDDELLGLCQLVEEMKENDPTCWEIGVLKEATFQLRTELCLHAQIEDEILLPRAALLENIAQLYI